MDLSPQLLEWCVLRRVTGGGVVKLGSSWLDHGRRTPKHLAETFGRLTLDGLAMLADPHPVALGQRRASVTDTGRARYEQLCREQDERLRSRAVRAEDRAALAEARARPGGDGGGTSWAGAERRGRRQGDPLTRSVAR